MTKNNIFEMPESFLFIYFIIYVMQTSKRQGQSNRHHIAYAVYFEDSLMHNSGIFPSS